MITTVDVIAVSGDSWLGVVIVTERQSPSIFTGAARSLQHTRKSKALTEDEVMDVISKFHPQC
jgi:hypothetical protein